MQRGALQTSALLRGRVGVSAIQIISNISEENILFWVKNTSNIKDHFIFTSREKHGVTKYPKPRLGLMVPNSLAGRVGEAAAPHHHPEAAGARPSLLARPGASACRPRPPQPGQAQEALTRCPLLPARREASPGRSIRRERPAGAPSASLPAQGCRPVPWSLAPEGVRAHELEFGKYSGDGKRYI